MKELLQIGLSRCLSNTVDSTDGGYFCGQKVDLQNHMHIVMFMGFHPQYWQDLNFPEFVALITVLQNFLMSLMKLFSLF